MSCKVSSHLDGGRATCSRPTASVRQPSPGCHSACALRHFHVVLCAGGPYSCSPTGACSAWRDIPCALESPVVLHPYSWYVLAERRWTAAPALLPTSPELQSHGPRAAPRGGPLHASQRPLHRATVPNASGLRASASCCVGRVIRVCCRAPHEKEAPGAPPARAAACPQSPCAARVHG